MISWSALDRAVSTVHDCSVRTVSDSARSYTLLSLTIRDISRTGQKSGSPNLAQGTPAVPALSDPQGDHRGGKTPPGFTGGRQVSGDRWSAAPRRRESAGAP